MGAFFLQQRTASDAPDPPPPDFLQAQHGAPKSLRSGPWTIYLFDKLERASRNYAADRSGDFAFATGTFVYRQQTGEAALLSVLADVKTATIDWSEAYGNFCLGLCTNGALQLLVDPIGLYKVYHNAEATMFSSSLLAVAGRVARLSINRQALYEYVFDGGMYRNETVFEQIRVLDAASQVGLSARATFAATGQAPRPAFREEPFEHHVERNLANLRRQARALVACFGNRFDTALSGGYDSRLILALLLDQGTTASLHVYGNAADPDVLVAKTIAAGEDIHLTHVDKAQAATVSVDEFPAIIQRNYFAFDGIPPDGLFDNGRDYRTRLDRAREGKVALNGGGGEIFRNFFYLPNRSYSADQFVGAFFAQFDPAVCPATFSEKEYFGGLVKAVHQALGHDRTKLHRAEIEYLYPHLRCRYWMGRNNSINNRFGLALTPFIDVNIVPDAVTVPLRWKDHGRLEAALIARLNPALASYSSSYGHAFAGPVPLGRKLKDYTTLYRPIALRRRAYRTRRRLSAPVLPYFMTDAFVRSVMDASLPCTRAFFRADRLKDPAQRNRLLSLEYMFQRLDVAGG